MHSGGPELAGESPLASPRGSDYDMTTFLEQLARKQLREILMQSPECTNALMKIYNDLEYEIYDRHIVDQLFQRSRSFVMEDALGWALWCKLVDSGRIYFASVPVGSTPSPDVCMAENNEKLKAISSIFDASFCGGTQGHDGTLILVEDSITLRNNAIFWEDHSKWSSELESKTVVLGKDTAFPLEVGYYDPHRAINTILSDFRLARWPYNHRYIYLFHYEEKF